MEFPRVFPNESGGRYSFSAHDFVLVFK